MGKKFKSFNDYYNTLKKQIGTICLSIEIQTDNNIEYEDLFQEAASKLFELYKNKKSTDVRYSLISVKNHLDNFVRETKERIKKSELDFKLPPPREQETDFED